MDFRQKTLVSFAQVRDDMDAFRNSMNDWIIFLDAELRKSRQEVSELRKRISELEMNRHLRF